jgi:type II secretory ATPase GspE/PulE/Tfp pilus assembly ATPase PilB-like protein
MSIQIDLRKTSIAPDILRLLPAALARKLNVIPVARRSSEQGGGLIVAFRDYEGVSETARTESVFDALDALEELLEEPVVPFFVEDKEAFNNLHKRIYARPGAEVSLGSEALFRDIINQALIQRASDIHLDADEDGATVLLRVDGKIRELRRISEQQMAELVAVIKLHADLDIAERRVPLDGAIALKLGKDDEISLRVATLPTLNGEHITLRILASSGAENLTEIESLCMTEEHQNLLKQTLEAPNGIILVSGPTGSGKTTTLYAALRHLRDQGGRHIVSLEDPVEMPLAHVTQVKIDEGGERVTFNKALRSVLRHDPDVVLIGEIRDKETADIAVRAALTGHLVLSTVHTNDALGVVTRLLDLGLPDYLVAATLRLVMAQRLVRRPAPHGMTWRTATEEECLYMDCDPANPPQLPDVHGTPLDGGTGYAGRAAIYEMVPVDVVMRELITRRAAEAELARCVFEERGLHTLRRDGIDKAKKGITTLSEVQAMTMAF